jgi:hypothetical protein
VVPAESTFQRALVEIDLKRFEPLMLQWQNEQTPSAPDPLIAIDGKHLRRSGGLASASASGQPSQRVHATVTLEKHESEITAVRRLLQQTEFTGQLLALDSLHTQHETLHQILYDHGADYLVPLKENQPTILATAASRHEPSQHQNQLPAEGSRAAGWRSMVVNSAMDASIPVLRAL